MSAEGLAIITTHGVTENGSCWSRPGVTDKLAAAGYRVIDLDMRAHGRSVPLGEGDKGYDVQTIADDFGRLADHLSIDRFHLLSHATGGMAALHYTCLHSDRLLSLMSTDASSATFPTDKYCDLAYENRPFEARTPPVDSPMADQRQRTSIRQTLEKARAESGGLFMSRFNANPDPDRCWQEALDILEASPIDHVADFQRHFYTNTDPKIALLRRIQCPVLLLLGEYDTMFIRPNELMAQVIPSAKHVVMKGLGHMTAIEDPDGLIKELLDFLASCPTR